QLQKKDVFTISPTGSGKTMTFWIPMLFNDDGIMIIITPLKLLGEKNEAEAQSFGMTAINLTADTATDQVFNDIQELKYQVIAVSPEHILKDSRFRKLFKSTKFTDRLFNVTLDEGHCVSEWGDSFRAEYGELGKLRWLLPSHVTFHVASATMPPYILRDVQGTLQMQGSKVVKIIRTNDRPNIHIIVEKLESSLKSMKDLDRVLNFTEGHPTTPFMVFVNQRDDAEKLAKYLTAKVSNELRDKFVCGEIWGIFCTDAAGMGLDLRNIRLVVQWRYTKSLCALLQRLGRAARDLNIEATVVYFVEAEYFDLVHGEKPKKRKRLSAKQKGKKRAKAMPSILELSSDDSDTAASEDENANNQPAVSTSDADNQSVPALLVDHPMPLAPSHSSHDCCERCSIKLSHLCCDTCSVLLSVYVEPAIREPSKRAKRRYKVPEYQMRDAEKGLRQKLQEWRELQMVEEDLVDGDFFGSQIIMSNDILDRIVDLAHAEKIADVVSLSEQTRWIYAEKYGPTIVKIVLTSIPSPPEP
ncbi:P-loop containing nucleoside triphosphate hydrolase protein, partial [Leucogyrophana mollusca]